MAFQLPNISHSLLIQSPKSPREKFITTTNHLKNSISKSYYLYPYLISSSSSSSLIKLETPPTELDAQDKELASPQVTADNNNNSNNNKQKNDFYVNLGLAVRTLREDLPLLFTKDLNYDIYRYFILQILI